MSALGASLVDSCVLDLFAGSGALGLESLSRGAEHVVFVERARAPLGVLRANIELLGAGEQCTVVDRDVFRFLKGPVQDFDLALADPPYQGDAGAALVERYLNDPFAHQLWLEHPSRGTHLFPEGTRTRRYGDTALSTITPDRS
jgi:16S rRNA (guanine966-N2)-methyltransferase